ncbi:MAG: aldose 1-epimerase [Acidobacteria bacterium]|nr:aldose 1-epimerase [Acidobacteriota bacterium]
MVRLADEVAGAELLIAPAFGNNAYDFRVHGKPVLWSPYSSLAEAITHPTYLGNPFLAPWANRIDGETYYANGKEYRLNPSLGNYRSDGFHQPIHGLLAYSPEWRVVGLSRSDSEACVSSRLEFWRHPGWMAQFPFAHSITMTYRLANGTVEVETVVETVTEHVELSSHLVPTGKRTPMPYRNPQPLAGMQLDDVFTGLVGNAAGLPEFVLEGEHEKVSVLYGPKYKVAVVYAPLGKNFVCFEPMSGPTNVFNLVHRGLWPELQTIAPGGSWSESFWIRTAGF